MATRISTLIKRLPACVPVFDKSYEEVDRVKPTHFIDDRGNLCISCEDAANYFVIDYYGEYRGGYPYIDEALEKFADKHNGYWEWRDCASIQFVRN